MLIVLTGLKDRPQNKMKLGADLHSFTYFIFKGIMQTLPAPFIFSYILFEEHAAIGGWELEGQHPPTSSTKL